MGVVKKTVSSRTRLLFPIIVTMITGLIAPKGLPLMGTIMLGNFMKECGVVTRLVGASENEIANITTVLVFLLLYLFQTRLPVAPTGGPCRMSTLRCN